MSEFLEEHHSRAADHLDRAAEHHRAAETAYTAGDYKSAAYEAHCAHGHYVQAIDHSDLAAMAHAELHDEQAQIAKNGKNDKK